MPNKVFGIFIFEGCWFVKIDEIEGEGEGEGEDERGGLGDGCADCAGWFYTFDIPGNIGEMLDSLFLAKSPEFVSRRPDPLAFSKGDRVGSLLTFLPCKLDVRFEKGLVVLFYEEPNMFVVLLKIDEKGSDFPPNTGFFGWLVCWFVAWLSGWRLLFVSGC